ncbi:MAG: hypothetical protein IJG52_03245 [Lachnospiraceae bacterium]|nr:hypothetical protein [Lachnospiraceae bacterium]
MGLHDELEPGAAGSAEKLKEEYTQEAAADASEADEAPDKDEADADTAEADDAAVEDEGDAVEDVGSVGEDDAGAVEADADDVVDDEEPAGGEGEADYAEDEDDIDGEDDDIDDAYDEDDDIDDDYDDDYDEEDAEDGDRPAGKKRKRRKPSPVLRALGKILIAASAVLALLAVIFFTCPLKTMYVEGCQLYSSGEIANIILSSDHPVITHNTIFLLVRRALPGNEPIPFVEKLHFAVESPETIRVTVEERIPAGYVQYSGRNLYFDMNGAVTDISPLTVQGVTYVGGLKVKSAEPGGKVKTETDNDMRLLLEALASLDKYAIHADSILVTESGTIDIFIGNVQIKLGRQDYDLKISRLSLILPHIPERGGLIDLTSFTAADENIVLQ